MCSTNIAAVKGIIMHACSMTSPLPGTIRSCLGMFSCSVCLHTNARIGVPVQQQCMKSEVCKKATLWKHCAITYLVTRPPIDWISKICNDDIKLAFCLLQLRFGIIINEFQLGICKSLLVCFQMLMAEVADILHIQGWRLCRHVLDAVRVQAQRSSATESSLSG